MRRLTRADIVSNEEYLKVRDSIRKEMIALKKKRRIQAGNRISFSFENRDTARYQIQEMMRVEKIHEEDKIQFEIDVYNDLVPRPGSLSATMFIEVPDPNQIRSTLDAMQGMDAGDAIYITAGGDKIFAEFESGRSKEDRISAVHYVKFHFTPEQIQNFRDAQVELHVDHPAYAAATALTQEQKEELFRDFQ